MTLAKGNNLYLHDRLAMPNGNWFCFYGRKNDNGIRIATSEDLVAIQDMVESAYSKYIDRIGARPAPMQVDYVELIKQAQVHVLCQDGQVRGAIALRLEGEILWLNNVVVDPSTQVQGFGRRLMSFAEERGRYLKTTEIRLYTNVKMVENLMLYPKLGYEEVERKSEDGFDRVYFAKKIR